MVKKVTPKKEKVAAEKKEKVVADKAAKSPKKVGRPKSLDGDKKKRRKRHVQTYSSYIYKVLKQVHKQMGISTKGMSIMNSFVSDIFERISEEASHLSKVNRRRTISSREIESAVKLIMGGELAKHATSEGRKALETYIKSAPIHKEPKKGSKGSKEKESSQKDS